MQYAHYGYVYCMLLARGLSNDGNDPEVLISGGGDGTVKLWTLDEEDEGTIKRPTCLANGDESILSMALDGTVLYCGRSEGSFDVWDLDTRQVIRTVKAHDADVLTLSVGHGLIFTGASNGVLKVIFPKGMCMEAKC